MAVTITPTEVKNGFSTTVPDAEIDLWIAVINQADECLDKNSVPDDVQRILKLTGVRYMLLGFSNDGKGNVRSETAPSGASRSYDSDREALWNRLLMADVTGCVRSVIDNKHQMQFMTIGPKRCKP